ncbi:MAG: alpha/beta hydrolase [Acidimicrobiia bacterium]|nr:alpha/beta hydrolase [Acidimicrobiia bacterium]
MAIAPRLAALAAARRLLRGGQTAGRTRDDVRFLDVPGARLRARVRGSGRRMLLLSADAPVVVEHYDRLLDLLERETAVAVFELPGFGFSVPRPGYDYSVDAIEAAVLGVREALGADRLVLGLSCAAGLVSLRLAERRPDLVDGLVMIQTVPAPEQLAWAEGLDPKRLLRRAGVGQAVMVARRTSTAKGWIRYSAGSTAQAEALWARAEAPLASGARFPLGSALQGLFADPPDEPDGLEVPAVAVWGESDRSHRHTDPLALRRVLPQATIHRLDGVGHTPELEVPEEFVDLVRPVIAS